MVVVVTRDGVGCRGGGKGGTKGAEDERNSLSLIEFLLTALRKSMVSCKIDRPDEAISSAHHMEIGFPTNVRHVTHVTFDRFDGFRGLPVEFEVEIPCKVPSASASVFGVSAESMQCSYDLRGNSVPTILLLMQERLYSQGGLKAEGIFRINPENSHEEDVRSQLNRGIVPDDIEVHCLAGLIKAWFRELPSGVLDGLSPEQVLQSNTEEDVVELVKQLQPTESALLNWVIDLMADVVEQEECNKMNARNIAVVFAPNMTQMSDPLTALMHAVQIMNLLKTLIMKTLREREDAATGAYSPISSHSSDQQTDGEIESQKEMDTSCELRGPMSDYNDNAHDSNSCNDEDEIESLSEIEECFLRQFDEKDNARILEESIGDLQRRHVSPISGFTSHIESSISFSDGKVESSALSTSDGEDSGVTLPKDDLENTSKRSENTDDVITVDKLVESAFTNPLFGV
ncbi:rho GTPase-activating protein 2-like [Actinidia eriantha]|uniref:rho GTPase-activating protein 2-like n=1 Tax=Actinidia eriantha TaxID=165200 RepID=UPI0025911F8F|nr:rho GTPase-activating protein 2-like [Actinidia eriantha]